MKLVGTVYEAWKKDTLQGIRYLELCGFKSALKQAGFRWSTSSASTKMSIHDGGDSMSDDTYKVGELDGNLITVFGSSRLEEFLENYDS